MRVPRRPAAAPDDKWLGLVRRKFNFWTPPSESPRELGIGTAFDQSRCGSSGRLDELKVLLPYEILRDQADGQSSPVMPGDPCVDPGVRGNLWIVETTHEIRRGIPRQVVRKNKV